MKNVVLCGKGKRCCPDVLVDENNVYIIDDDEGGAVQITRQQFDILKQKIIDGEI